jgi:outer membrane lipopolysaccharide assembly protein LptE/RlpB
MKTQNSRVARGEKTQSLLLVTCYLLLVTLYGCGYHIVGSTSIPFDNIVIRPVQNKTYEPGLEDVMHHALSREFITQGINVKSLGSLDNMAVLETVIRDFSLNTVAVSDDEVKEQSVVMKVDFRLIEDSRVIEFNSVKSPIKITFQAAGSVTESVIEKQKAIERVTQEIARELVSRIVLRYVE